MLWVFFLCVRHRNCSSGPAHPHQFMCETENDPAATSAEFKRWYNRHFRLPLSSSPHDHFLSLKRNTLGGLWPHAFSTLLCPSHGFKSQRASGYFCLSPVEDEDALCGTLAVAIHSACGLQQPACTLNIWYFPEQIFSLQRPTGGLFCPCFRRVRVCGSGRLRVLW